MWWGLLVVLVGASCAGIGAVLQALAARAVPDTGGGLRAGLILDLVRQWRFLAGIGLDLLSFVASFIALRVLPVFLVQATVALNLAVTALVAWRMLGTHLRRVEMGAVVAVCLGLAALGVSATQQGQTHGDLALHLGLAAGAVAIGVLAFFGARLPGRWSAAVLGGTAGLAFGLVNLCSRVLSSFSPGALAADPAFWAMPVAGIFALLCYNTALQRESVVAASAGTIVGQTVFPAVIGLVVLGDDTRPGYEPFATVGFVVAIVGALLLTRFGDISEDATANVSTDVPTDVPTDSVTAPVVDLPRAPVPRVSPALPDGRPD